MTNEQAIEIIDIYKERFGRDVTIDFSASELIRDLRGIGYCDTDIVEFLLSIYGLPDELYGVDI